MADPPSTRAFPFRFAESMPASVRDVVTQWWRSTGSKAGRSWEWLRGNTASPDAIVTGDEYDSFPPSFADWYEILGRICSSEAVASAAMEFEAQFESGHAARAELWEELIVVTMRLPERFKHEDKRTNKGKAKALNALRHYAAEIAKIVEKDQYTTKHKFEPRSAAKTLPIRAAEIDSPQVPDELRYDHELRKLTSERPLFNAGLFRNIWSDPAQVALGRAEPGPEPDDEPVLVPVPVPTPHEVRVSVDSFGRIAQALDRPLAAALEEVSRPDLMQLSKGTRAWHRYAVHHLVEVFARSYGEQRLAELRPGPNAVIAALANAAVPEAVIEPVDQDAVSEIRARLSSRKKAATPPFSEE